MIDRAVIETAMNLLRPYILETWTKTGIEPKSLRDWAFIINEYSGYINQYVAIADPIMCKAEMLELMVIIDLALRSEGISLDLSVNFKIGSLSLNKES